MKPVLDFFRNVLKFHKLKIFATLAFAVFFFIVFFPYGDLGNLLTTKVYDGSGQQLYVHAQDLGLGVVPVPGIDATDVSIEPGAKGAPFTPLHFDSLSIKPMVSAFLAFHAGAALEATGVFGGEASVAAKTANSIFSGAGGPIEISTLELRDVSISSLISYLMGGTSGGLKVGGRVSAESTGLLFDPTYKEPIAGDLALMIENLSLPTTIPVPNFGEFTDLPQVKIQKTDFKTQIGKNKLRIVQGNLGQNGKDPISGRILGEMDIHQFPGGGIQTGAFNMCFEINVTQAFYDALAKRLGSAIQLIESAVNKFKRSDSTPGIHYGFKATGPNIADVQTWVTQLSDCKAFAGQ